jgi:hypothetical protein
MSIVAQINGKQRLALFTAVGILLLGLALAVAGQIDRDNARWPA